MSDLSIYAASFPVAAPADAHWTDRTVKQGHADYCAAHGHAEWIVDGVDQHRCPRCGTVTDAAARAALIAGETDTYVSPAAVAAPAPCTHWECALMGDTCTVTGAPAMMPPRTARTYTARRIARVFYEYTGADEFTPGDDFNVDGTPHYTHDDVREFDSMRELIDAVRRDGVTFAATGNDWAADPDGSYVIDYATAEREAVSWHFDGIAPDMLARVIIPAVDAR